MENQFLILLRPFKKKYLIVNSQWNVYCEKVNSVSDIYLRVQFIRRLRDNWIREQILQSNLTSFYAFPSKAIALEASKIYTMQLSKPIQSIVSENLSIAETNSIQNSSRYSRTRSRSSESKRFQSASKGVRKSKSKTRNWKQELSMR
jgi:hypothetical protein